MTDKLLSKILNLNFKLVHKNNNCDNNTSTMLNFLLIILLRKKEFILP